MPKWILQNNLRRMEEETKEKAEKEAKKVIGTSIQRFAGNMSLKRPSPLWKFPVMMSKDA